MPSYACGHQYRTCPVAVTPWQSFNSRFRRLGIFFEMPQSAVRSFLIAPEVNLDNFALFIPLDLCSQFFQRGNRVHVSNLSRWLI